MIAEVAGVLYRFSGGNRQRAEFLMEALGIIVLPRELHKLEDGETYPYAFSSGLINVRRISAGIQIFPYDPDHLKQEQIDTMVEIDKRAWDHLQRNYGHVDEIHDTRLDQYLRRGLVDSL